MLLAVCVGHRMTTGRHAAELTLGRELISKSKHNLMRWSGSHDRRFGFRLTHGRLSHNWTSGECTSVDAGRGTVLRGICAPWDGQQRFGPGDVVGLLLDCDAGTLTVKKNGARLGVAATGLTGEFCWAAAMFDLGKAGAVRIAAADAAADGW